MKLYDIFTCEAFLFRVSDAVGGGWNSYGSKGELVVSVCEEGKDKGCGFVTWRNVHTRTLGLNTRIVFDNPIAYNKNLKEATFKTASRVPLGNGMKNIYRLKFSLESSGERFVLFWRILNQVNAINVANSEARDKVSQGLQMEADEIKRPTKKLPAGGRIERPTKKLRMSNSTEKKKVEAVKENETPKSHSSQFSGMDGGFDGDDEEFDAPMSQDWQIAFNF